MGDNNTFNVIGVASLHVNVYAVDKSEYRDKEGKIQNMYRAVTDKGLCTISEETYLALKAADVGKPCKLSASSYVKDGMQRFNISI